VITKPAGWLEAQLTAFERATEHRTTSLLIAIAVYARETHPVDPAGAYAIFVERILQQADVDADLILDAAPVAWEGTKDRPLFVPLQGTNVAPQDGVERTPAARRSLRVYAALLEHAREHGLPYHAVALDLGRLATRLGYLVKGQPDKSRALGDVRQAEDDQILVRLDRGRQRTADQGGLCAIYCLRGSYESLLDAAAHGMTQREYRKRVAGEVVAAEVVQLESQQPMVAALPAAQPKPAPRVYKEPAQVRLLRLARMCVSYLPADVRGHFPDDALPGRVERHLAQHGDDSFALFHDELLREVNRASQLTLV
jgi:hypothetical protein